MLPMRLQTFAACGVSSKPDSLERDLLAQHTETANTEHARTQRDHTHISIGRAAWQVGMIVT